MAKTTRKPPRRRRPTPIVASQSTNGDTAGDGTTVEVSGAAKIVVLSGITGNTPNHLRITNPLDGAPWGEDPTGTLPATALFSGFTTNSFSAVVILSSGTTVNSNTGPTVSGNSVGFTFRASDIPVVNANHMLVIQALGTNNVILASDDLIFVR